MNVRQSIIKLLVHYLPHEFLRHIANELEQQATHFLTVGAPIRYDYMNRQALVIRAAACELERMPYEETVVPKS